MDEELMKAIFNDSINVLNIFIPIPKESISLLYDRMKNSPLNKFLDYNDEKILNYYAEEKSQLTLLFNNGIKVLPQYLEIDNTFNHKQMDHFIFNFNDQVFEVPNEIKEFTQEPYGKLARGLKYSNEENLRLSRLTMENGIYTFYTQPVYYECYLHTNLLMDYPVEKNKTVRNIVHSNGTLEDFSNSKLANHLGINILLFTPAGNLVLPLRSKKVNYAPSEYSSSISGAVSAHDVSDGNDLNHFSIIREGIEELGLKRNDIIKGSIRFLGLTRDLIRGGKPEMFFIMNTTLTKNELIDKWKSAKDKWENKQIEFFHFDESIFNPLKTIEEQESFQSQINDLFNKLGQKMSLPLLTNIALWIKYKQNGN